MDSHATSSGDKTAFCTKRPAGAVAPMSAAALVAGVRRLVTGPRRDLGELARFLARFARGGRVPAPDTWRDSEGRYTRVLLNRPDDAFQLVLVAWPPGARSAIHDHAGTTGIVVPLAGELRETKYAVTDEPEGVRLHPVRTECLRPGLTSQLTPEDGSQIHDMVNASLSWAMTLHVYVDAIRRFCVYQRDDDGRYHRRAHALWFDDTQGAETWDRAVARPEPSTDDAGHLGRTGGCACGHVRYALDAPPVVQLSCHCSDCQRSTGAAITPLAFYPTAALRITAGRTKTIRFRNDSGYLVSKHACDRCDAVLINASTSHPHLVGLHARTLDDHRHFRATTHIYVGRRRDPAA